MLTAVVEAFDRLGAYEGVLFVFSRAVERLSAGRVRLIRYHFVTQPVAADTTRSGTTGKLVVRRASMGDAAVGTLPRPAAVIDRRFRSGDVCFVAEIDRRLAGCLWLAEGRYVEDEVRCDYAWRPHADAAWDYDVYVTPEFRLSRAFVRLWEVAHRYLYAKGIRWTLSRISAFNPESLAAHRRLGARRIGVGTFLVLGPVQIACLSASPYFHISLSPTSRPKLVLSLSRLDGQNSSSATAH